MRIINNKKIHIHTNDPVSNTCRIYPINVVTHDFFLTSCFAKTHQTQFHRRNAHHLTLRPHIMSLLDTNMSYMNHNEWPSQHDVHYAQYHARVALLLVVAKLLVHNIQYINPHTYINKHCDICWRAGEEVYKPSCIPYEHTPGLTG